MEHLLSCTRVFKKTKTVVSRANIASSTANSYSSINGPSYQQRSMQKFMCSFGQPIDYEEGSREEVKVGDTVTFNCPATGYESRFIQWFKQSLGKIIEVVATGSYSNVKLSGPFNNQRFQVKASKDQTFLTISSVTKEDEAEYFCQAGGEYLQVFKAGFLLTVKDCDEQPAVYVRQTPGLAAAQLGESVSFQCLMISKNEENNITCPGNQDVHWFRTASGTSQPGVIFTSTDLNNQTAGKSCFYRFTKTLNDSSDAGIYYCALAMCGEILFGNGTRVEMRAKLDPLVPVLGGLLACCVTVCVLLLTYLCRRRTSGHQKERITFSSADQQSNTDQTSFQGEEEQPKMYAMIDFTMKRAEPGRNQESRESSGCLYTAVRAAS
ncbi:Ig heavy chain V region AC38 [Oryzias melastigma]|uniref:Ig heavy chain V region AC38 n=1 Tax=Oryzias melastigma TaxID=30732 RepID=A0A834CGT8_ORYME|nr:Ig heavy chain V region AC38 [Oryzias melastigma]